MVLLTGCSSGSTVDTTNAENFKASVEVMITEIENQSDRNSFKKAIDNIWQIANSRNTSTFDEAGLEYSSRLEVLTDAIGGKTYDEIIELNEKMQQADFQVGYLAKYLKN